MSFGFSVGDILAATKILHGVYATCFSNVSNTKLAYFTFGEQVKGLADQLEALWHVLSEHEARQQRRRQQAGGALRSGGGNIDMTALAAMIGDFRRTIARAQDLLNTGSVFKRSGGYITKIRWTFTTEEEVGRLTQDCQFHMTKIQFVIKTLELRLLGQISDQIDEAHASLMSRLHDLEERLLTALGASHAPIPQNPPPTYQTSERLTALMAHGRVISRFEQSLRHHPRFRSILHEIPLEEWTEAAAWWIERGRCVVVRSHEIPADLYLNMLKAAWLLRKVEGTVAFQRLERNSLWIEYICTLSEAIVNELTTLTSPALNLALPDEDTLLKLPSEMFHVWLNTAPTETVLTIHDERPGEEKLLELPLGTSLDPDRFSRKLLVFRKDLGSLRLCDSTENLENGSRSAEEFVVICAETELLAQYITTPLTFRQTPNYSIMMRNRLQSREYSFLSSLDLYTFQRAITSYQTVFSLPSPVTLIAATRSSTLTAHAMIQIWNPKPLTRETTTPASPPSSSAGAPFNLARTQTAHSVTTSTSSDSNTSSSGYQETTNIISLSLPKSPLLIIYLYTPTANWQLLQLPLDDNMAIAPERCCGKRLTHRLQSTAQVLSPFHLPSSSGEPLCCLRTVLEPKRGNAEAILYEAAAGGELDLLKVGKKGDGKKVAYKYLALDFGGEKEKRAVEKAVEQVMLLRRKIKQKALEGVKADVGIVKKWGILR